MQTAMSTGNYSSGYLRYWFSYCRDAVSAHLPANSRQPQQGATIFGYLKAESGVGEAARRLFLSLRAVGYPVAAKSLPIPAFEDSDMTLAEEWTGSGSPYRTHIFHFNADTTLHLKKLVKRRNLHGRYKIGVWTWELPQLPISWHRAADVLDEIWVPSEFVRLAVAPTTSKPVHVFPHAVPKLEAPDNSRDYFGIQPDKFVILVSIDLNSYIARKNPIAAIEAVRRAFSDDTKNVLLIVKMHGKNQPSARLAIKQAIRDLPHARLIDRVLSRHEMTLLQASCDVYLSLHRSEGFGLCVAECMALGKLVIVTNYSGTCDYVDAHCGAPVGFSLRAVAPGQYPFGDGQFWAEPDLSHAAELLRHAFKDPDWRRDIAARAREKIDQQLSYHEVGTLMRARLAEIDARLDRR
jgi:glycosyltransferase involved in cell wall biosynthesis